jgi:DNA-binding SARP family transcriptional activator
VSHELSSGCAARTLTSTLAFAPGNGAAAVAGAVTVDPDAMATHHDEGALGHFLSWPGDDALHRMPVDAATCRVDESCFADVELCLDRLAVMQPLDAGEPGGDATPVGPLCVYTLGRFTLVRDGRALTFHGKSPRKPLDLLLALIALGARDVPTGALMRAVWPDEASSDLHNLFDNTLYRLRHLLACPTVLPLNGAKLSLDTRQCWVDALAFDRLAAASDTSLQPSAVRNALRLYQGHFLQGETARPWAIACRERLRSRLHRLLIAAGERLELGGGRLEAADLYERGLEVDPLAEDLYQRLMNCRHHLGEHAEAVRVYRRCRDVLAAELGVAPSAATQAAAQQAAR